MPTIPHTTLTRPEVDALAASPVIVGHRRGGLFDRVICLLNVIRIANVMGAEPRFLWENGAIGDNAHHRYEDGFTAILSDPRVQEVSTELGASLPTKVTMRYGMPVLIPGEDLDDVKSHLGVIARDLVLADGRRLGDTLGAGRFSAALHVRQGDARSLTWLLVKCFPPQGWLRVIQETAATASDPAAHVYIASDSSDFLAEARRRFGRRVVIREDVTGPEPSKLRADFADAVLLSQGARLVAPRASAFSLFSSILGGLSPVPPEVVLGIAPIARDLVNVARDHYCRDVQVLLDACDDHGVSSGAIEGIRAALNDFPARHRDATFVAARRGGPRARSMPRAPLDWPVDQPEVLALLDRVRPRSCGIPFVRVGGPSDGGYVIPDDIQQLGGVVSLGIGNEVSFDLALAERGLPVIQVDHTVDGPPISHPGFTFLRKAWAQQDAVDAMSLASITDDLDRCIGAPTSDTPRDLLLKFDVEGAEWGILPDLDPDLLRRFRIITCELHGLTRLTAPDRYREVTAGLAALTRQHTSVHLHVNNTSLLGWVKGVPVPSVVEVTFLRNDRAAFTDVPVRIPTDLDAPNDPQRPDVVLSPFG